jgi:hypothetical protein
MSSNFSFRPSQFLNDPRVDNQRSQEFINNYYDNQVSFHQKIRSTLFSDKQVIKRLQFAAELYKAEANIDETIGKKRRRQLPSQLQKYLVDNDFEIARSAVKQFIANEKTYEESKHKDPQRSKTTLLLDKIDIQSMFDDYITRVRQGYTQLPSIPAAASTAVSAATSSSSSNSSQINANASSSFQSNASNSLSSVVAQFELEDVFEDINPLQSSAADLELSASTSYSLLSSVRELAIPASPSPLLTLSSWLFMWRHHYKLSQTAMDSLLNMLGQVFSFVNHSTSTTTPAAIAASLSSSSSSSSTPSLPSSAAADFATSEFHLRKKLDLPPVDELAESFSYIQCPYQYCGKLFSKAQFKELVSSQLSAGVISTEQQAFCDHPRCPQTPFYYERVIEENKSRSSSTSTSSSSQSSSAARYVFAKPSLYSHQPLVRTQVWSLREWLLQVSSRPGWCDKLDSWLQRSSAPYTCHDSEGVRHYGDIYDGDKWKKDPDLCAALREKKNSPIMLSVNADGLNPHNRGNKSVYVVFITVLNLPRAERFLIKNVLLYAIVPGVDNRKCSTAQLEQVIQKLVDELKELYQLQDPPTLVLNGVPRRVKLHNLVCDQPAVRDVAGFCGHSGDKACMYCVASILYHRHMDNTSTPSSASNSSISSSSSTASSSSSSSLSSSSPEVEYYRKTQDYISTRLLRTHKNRTSADEQARVTPDMAQWTDIMNITCPYTESTMVRSASEVRAQMINYRNLSQNQSGSSRRHMHDHAHLQQSESRLMSADEVKQMMDSHQATFKQCEKQHRQTGVRWTPFVQLSYYNPIDSCCIDVMHTVWLGVTKSYMDCLMILGSDGLNDAKLKQISTWLKHTFVPQDIGKMQSKWSGSLGHFKSIEWADFITLYALPALIHVGVSRIYLLPLIPLQRMSFLLRKHVLTSTDIDEIELNIRLFSALVCYVCGPSVESINFHLLHHIPHLLRLYGPCCNWWCFPYERFNGLLKQYPRNDSSVAPSMMRSWNNHQQAIDKFTELRKLALETEKAIDQKYKLVCQLDEQINLLSQCADAVMHALWVFKTSYEEHDGDSRISIPTLPTQPSSAFFASKLTELVGGELIFDNDPLCSDAAADSNNNTTSGVVRKINSQGSQVGINFQLDFNQYIRLRDICNSVEFLATGAESIPCLPKEKDTQIARQIHHLDQAWSLPRKGNIRAFKSPPYIDQLTSALLNDFYETRYPTSYCPVNSQVSPSSSFRGASSNSASSSRSHDQMQQTSTAFIRCRPGDQIECYRQMFIYGELYSSRWSNNEAGFISSLFEDKQQSSCLPWCGQVFFYFSHILHFRDPQSQQTLPVKHNFAFVQWFPQASSLSKARTGARGSQLEISASTKDWSYPPDMFTKSSESAASSSTVNVDPKSYTISSNKEDGSLSEEAKKKITSKKDELKSFMQQTDNSASSFIKQIEDILADRLLQDFPLFEFKTVSGESFAYWSILPLSRIWNRGCVANATKQNKVYINIPDKKHYS